MSRSLRCSFCDKAQDEVRKLIAGPSAFICDECVDACRDIIRMDTLEAREPAPAPPEPPTDWRTEVVTCRLCEQRLLWEQALAVEHRGFLCPGCVGAVEAAVAQRVTI